MRFNKLMSMDGPTSHRFVSQRLSLHYVDWGNRDAPTLVMMHGGRDHCRSWDWLAKELRDDWHVVAPDLRGHGDSDRSPDGDYSTPVFMYDFAQFLFQFDGPVTIIAHSFGANMATRFAGLYPDKVQKLVNIEGLFLTVPMPDAKGDNEAANIIRNWIDQKRKASSRAPSRFQTFEETFERMQSANEHLSEEQARHLAYHGATRDEDGLWRWKFDDGVHIVAPIDLLREEIKKLWTMITCPVLFLWGAESWIAPPTEDGSIDCFQNATLEIFENAGHWVHHDRFDDVVKSIKAFLGS